MGDKSGLPSIMIFSGTDIEEQSDVEGLVLEIIRFNYTVFKKSIS